jgi:hypothetical protein
MKAYNGTSSGHLSNAVDIRGFCKAWKKPGGKELRRSERQEARAAIRKEFTEAAQRKTLLAHIARQEARWQELCNMV